MTPETTRNPERMTPHESPAKEDPWETVLTKWGATGKNIKEHISELLSIGDHDLFYGERPKTDWNKVQGNITCLNMNGWTGDDKEVKRTALFAHLADTGTLVFGLIDHRRTTAEIKSAEYEIETLWTGSNSENREKPGWAHAPAKTRHIGGISIGIHPILKRYTDMGSIHADKWGRWTTIDLVGKHRIIKIIAAYRPVESEGNDTMWTYQTKQIHKHKTLRDLNMNPIQLFDRDLENLIIATKEEGKEIILLG
jgi:hypothetical protein